MSTSATPEPVIRQIVEAMRTLAGPHPGFRPVHAKGLVCSGTFRASADAPRVTRAPHFTGQSVPTIIRFANANGNPDVHDGVPNVRSMAVKFQLSDGKSADILANSVEGFVARTPEELLEFLRAQLPVAGQRSARPRRGSALSRRPSRRPRLRRAPDEEAGAGQLCAGDLPRRARLPLHRRGWHEPIRPLSLCAAGRGGLSLP